MALKRTLYTLLAIVGALTAAQPAQGQQLWADTSAGMSVEEVLALHPSAERMPRHQVVEMAPELASDGKTVLVMRDVVIQGKPYISMLFFDHEGLLAVLVTLAATPVWEDVSPIYDTLLAVMEEKYGVATGNEREDSDIVRSMKHSWALNGREIRLQAHEFPLLGDGATLTIQYATKDAEQRMLAVGDDRDKL